MTVKYHVNDNGDVRQCEATTKPCRFSESDHFTDPVEAREHYEATHDPEDVPLVKKPETPEEKNQASFTRLSKDVAYRYHGSETPWNDFADDMFDDIHRGRTTHMSNEDEKNLSQYMDTSVVRKSQESRNHFVSNYSIVGKTVQSTPTGDRRGFIVKTPEGEHLQISKPHGDTWRGTTKLSVNPVKSDGRGQYLADNSVDYMKSS